jgi:hypothetical protein
MAELRYTGGRSPLLPSMMSAPIDRDGLIGDLVHIEDNAHGANPYSAGSLLGKIVLVRRGKVTFDTKVRNVETAGGASALIVVDSGDGTSINVNIRNSAGGLHEPKLVLVGVERSAGEELIKLTRGGSVVRAAIHACSTPVGRAFQKVANSAPDSHGEGPPKVGWSADGKVSDVDVLGRSAAMIAAALGNKPLGNELLARLDDDGICCVDEDGDKALAHAARNGHLGTGRLLLQHKPSCSKRLRDSLNRAGFSPLSLAAEYGRLAFCSFCLSAAPIQTSSSSTQDVRARLVAMVAHPSTMLYTRVSTRSCVACCAAARTLRYGMQRVSAPWTLRQAWRSTTCAIR